MGTPCDGEHIKPPRPKPGEPKCHEQCPNLLQAGGPLRAICAPQFSRGVNGGVAILLPMSAPRACPPTHEGRVGSHSSVPTWSRLRAPGLTTPTQPPCVPPRFYSCCEGYEPTVLLIKTTEGEVSVSRAGSGAVPGWHREGGRLSPCPPMLAPSRCLWGTGTKSCPRHWLKGARGGKEEPMRWRGHEREVFIGNLG